MTTSDADRPTGPHAVLWDMDGTLLDSEPIWDIAMERFALRNGIVMSPALRESTLGNSLPDAMGKIYAAADVAVSDRDVPGDSRWLLDTVAVLFQEDLPWRPGATEALDLVRDAGIPMALVTNTVRELTEVALDTIGRHRFAVTVCGDEVQRGKPAPDPYLRAAELLGVGPTNVWRSRIRLRAPTRPPRQAARHLWCPRPRRSPTGRCVASGNLSWGCPAMT